MGAMSNSARIVVFDTTLRDGEQAPGFSMDVPAKLAMARALDELGVDIIEAGFPIAAPADAVKLSRSFTDDVEFSAEDATRSNRDFLCRVIEAVIDAGATTVNLPDTVGYATPDEMRDFFEQIIGRVPNATKAIFSAHCHNELGLAVANSLAAIQGGVRQVGCSINGIRERAG